VPGTVWGTAPNLTAKFMIGAVLAPQYSQATGPRSSAASAHLHSRYPTRHRHSGRPRSPPQRQVHRQIKFRRIHADSRRHRHGFVSIVAIPGQIGLGALSDRVGREWVWTVACGGFAICYGALMAIERVPSYPLLYPMVFSQGFLGYSMTSVMGPIVAEIFEGPHYGSIFGALTVALIGGGAAGPWAAAVIHDTNGSYRLAFLLAIICCVVSAAAIWTAAPRKVRQVPGQC
jgi:hypothetical protein